MPGQDLGDGNGLDGLAEAHLIGQERAAMVDLVLAAMGMMVLAEPGESMPGYGAVVHRIFTTARFRRGILPQSPLSPHGAESKMGRRRSSAAGVNYA